MTKDVIFSIKGIHESDGDEPVEVITVGKYYNKNNKHYVVYEDLDVAGENGPKKTTVRFDKNQVEVIKADSAVHMIFEKEKKNFTYYDTPVGEMLVGITANKLDVDEKEDRIAVNIEYELELQEQAIGQCYVTMSVMPKSSGFVRL